MKQDIHPEYREVVFLDMSTNKKFLCRSAAPATETTDFEGETYPCIKVSISSSSHPFFTGDETFVDTEGRVDKFKKRYAGKPAAKMENPEKEAESAAKKAAPKTASAKKAPAKKAVVGKKPVAPKAKK